jgi:MFS family permease
MLDTSNKSNRVAAGAISILEIDENRQYRSIRTLIGIGIVSFFAQAAWATLNFSALPMWVHFHLHQGQYIGIIIGSFIVVEAVLRPFLGSVSDKIGRKPVILFGPFLGIFTSTATVFVPSALLLIPLRAIDGLGLAGFWPAGYAIVGDSTGEERRGTGASVLNGSAMAGVALGWLAGGYVNDLTHSLAGSFYFVSGLFALTVIIGFIILPEPQQRHRHAEEHEGWKHLPTKQELIAVVHTVPDMLVLNVIIFIGVGLLMPIFKLYAVQQFGLSEVIIGELVAPAALALGLIAIPLGRLADKWGTMTSVKYGLLLCAGGMWIVASSVSFKIAIIGAAIIGAGFIAAYPAWMAVIGSSVAESKRGQILGSVGMAEGLGAVIGVIIGPVIYASRWNPIPNLGVTHFTLPFYLSAVLLTIASILAFTWVNARRAKGLL